MKYNEKLNTHIKDTHHTVIKISEIRRNQIKNGSYIITLVGQDGEMYTAFEQTWEQQHIDMDPIEEGDEMEVTYYANGDYKNFLKVEVLTDKSHDKGFDPKRDYFGGKKEDEIF